MFHDIHEIIQKAPIRASLGKLPPKDRPEECLRSHPHPVFQQMQETGSGHKQDSEIPSLPEINISGNQNYNNKNKSVCKKPSTCKNIFKQKPAYGLIDQVRQQGSQCNEPVIKMTFERRKSKACKEEDGERDSDMAKDEHCESSRGYTFKKLHIRKRSLCGDL